MFPALKEHGAALKQCSDKTLASNKSSQNTPSKFPHIFLKVKLFLFLFLSILSFNCVSSRYLDRIQGLNIPSTSPHIRVLLSEAESVFEFKAEETINLFIDQKLIAKVGKGNNIHFKIADGILRAEISSKNFTGANFEISGEVSSPITFDNKKYLGVIRVVRAGEKIFLINELRIENYLRGVLPLEMGIQYQANHLEALKAFSITARTFALMRISEKKTNFDVYADTRDQLYGGVFTENTLEKNAIDETKGEILGFSDTLAKIFYHANCGGSTENVENVFNPKAIPYLVSNNDGNNIFCSRAKNFSWKETFTADEILEVISKKFNTNNKELTISDVKIDSRTSSGRAGALTFILSNDSSYKFEGREIRNHFRQKQNNGILRSLLFDIQLERTEGSISKMIINGKGSGHGVGLCQWGCIFRSEAGQSYKQIIEHYFPGTKIHKIYE